MPLVITCMQVAGNTSKNGKNKKKMFKAKENRWKAKKTPKKRLKLWKMNVNQGIHRLAPWNKQTTRTATQIQKTIPKLRKKNKIILEPQIQDS